MFFIPAATRKRHEFIDKSLHGAQEALAMPAVAKALGDYATRLSDVGSRLYIPNVRHGKLIVPQEYRGTDAIAVAAVPMWGVVRFDDQWFSQNPRQQAATRRTVESWGLPEGADRMMAKICQALESQIAHLPQNKRSFRNMRGEGASVTYLSSILGMTNPGEGAGAIPARSLVKFRPFLVLCMLFGRESYGPVEILHEYEHIDQNEREPVVAVADRSNENAHFLRQELEAYYVGATVITAMQQAGIQYDDISRQLDRERIRQGVNGGLDDPFAPSQALHDRYVQAGLPLI